MRNHLAIAFQFLFLFQLLAAAAPPREVEIFNGKDLTGWSGTDGYWSSDQSHQTVHVVKTNVGDNYWSIEMQLPLDQFDQSAKSGDSFTAFS